VIQALAAAKFLCAIRFAESSFFPVPPDAMLAPMALSQPDKALRYWQHVGIY